MSSAPLLSVVTPTLGRPGEVRDLLEDLSQQELLPAEVILVDGATDEDRRTEEVVESMASVLPFACHHIRHGGGTAIQRNVGLDRAKGQFVALIDDDIRLQSDFFDTVHQRFQDEANRDVGGITGYIDNVHLDPTTSKRWQWYRRLGLFSTYEPGRYDYRSGYPINRYLQPPYQGEREIDFMGAGCAVWRREVLDQGLRFAPFFSGYGILEDAHFALRARRKWRLLECGDAHCDHLKSPSSRVDTREIARKSALNYRFVFLDIVEDRGLAEELRFWRVQLFDLLRFTAAALESPSASSFGTILGKIEGMYSAARLEAPAPNATALDSPENGDTRTLAQEVQ